MKNYLQNGHIVRVTTPAGGIASGDALIVGSIFGIAADLPLNFHPTATGARFLFTPVGAG